MMRFTVKTLAAAAMLGAALAAHAGIVKIDASAFTAQAGKITFSEKVVNTVNPTYAPGDYGGVVGAPTVTFDGYFTGQSLGNALTCPAGAALSGCVVGSPTGLLSLDPGSPDTFITTDGSNPTSPVLSGSPRFNGPIAILFSADLAGVGLDGGFFDSIGSTAITAFARDGSLLGSVTNTKKGIEFLGLVTGDGSEKIAGLLFSLVGAEAAGFAIDNVRFGKSGQVVVPGVPEPGSFALAGLALAGLGLARRRKA